MCELVVGVGAVHNGLLETTKDWYIVLALGIAQTPHWSRKGMFHSKTYVSPPGIRLPITRNPCVGRIPGTTVIHQEDPAKQPGDQLPQTPPARHERQQPLVLTRQVLEKHRRIQHEIPAGPKRGQAREQTQHDPIRRRARHDAEDARDEQAVVERILPSNQIRGKAPEQRTNQHTDVDRNRQAVFETRVEFVCGIARDDGLDKQHKTVHGVAEAVEHEELPLVARHADLVDGVVDQVHFGVEDGVEGFLAEDVAFAEGGEVVAVVA